MNRKNCSTLCCSSYDKVINFKFKKDDFFTKKLIDNYFYCFFESNEYKDETLKKLDDFMYLYVTNRKFFGFVKHEFLKIEKNSESYYYDLLNEIFNIYDKYSNGYIVDINNSIWI